MKKISPKQIVNPSFIDSPICFATHHKTGTMYFQKVARELTNKFKLDRISTLRNKATLPEDAEKTQKRFYLLTHTSKNQVDALVGLIGDNIIHSIRDPRTLIQSAMKYHLKADEAWLHIANPEYGGLSYQQYLLEMPSDEERLIAEISRSRSHIQNMIDVFRSGKAKTIRIETLSHDITGKTHFSIINHLNIHGLAIPAFMDSLIRNSLFAKDQLPSHSTTGVQVYKNSTFPKKAEEKYLELYGDVHLELGYANDGCVIDGD